MNIERKQTSMMWILKNTEAIAGLKRIDAFQIVRPITGTTVCSGLKREDGEFIVRAVNSHEENVKKLAALRRLLLRIATALRQENGDDTFTMIVKIQERIHRAIALAEEEATK